jgi:hypothetical protein
LSAPPEKATPQIDRRIDCTDVNDVKDKTIREFNGNDVRKLVIALSYHDPATTIFPGISFITSLAAQTMDCHL